METLFPMPVRVIVDFNKVVFRANVACVRMTVYPGPDLTILRRKSENVTFLQSRFSRKVEVTEKF